MAALGRADAFDDLPLVPGFNKVAKKVLRELLAQKAQAQAR
jgi:hypothetical protein